MTAILNFDKNLKPHYCTFTSKTVIAQSQKYGLLHLFFISKKVGHFRNRKHCDRENNQAQESLLIPISDITSKIEGQDLGEMRQLWRDTAASEMRLTMMSGLKGKNIGFNEATNHVQNL